MVGEASPPQGVNMTEEAPDLIGQESSTGTAIDPSKNVLDLVKAAIKRLDDLNESGTRRLDQRIDNESDKSTAMRAQRDFYETRIEVIKGDFTRQIASILERQQDKSAILLAQTVDKVTERLAAVEKNQYTTAGQAIVRDPAVSDAITQMSATIQKLTTSNENTVGRREGLSAAGAILLGFGGLVGTVVIVAGFILARTN